MADRLSVSDHALVRWLDRTGAMPIEQLRQLLAASLERAHEAAGRIEADRYLIVVDGVVFVVRDSTVVTALDDDGRHERKLRRGKRRDRK